MQAAMVQASLNAGRKRSKTQIRLTRRIYCYCWFVLPLLMMYSNAARLYPLIFLQCCGEETCFILQQFIGQKHVMLVGTIRMHILIFGDISMKFVQFATE